MSEHARLRWLCRRGMKELDVLLGTYLARSYTRAEACEQRAFARLLDYPDPDLYVLLTGRGEADDAEIRHVVERIRRDAEL